MSKKIFEEKACPLGPVFGYIGSLAVFLIFAIEVQATEITSFKFSYEDIGWEGEGYWEGDIDNEAKTITFASQKWIENIDRLAAIFELEEHFDVNIGTEQQFSGISRNDFRKEIVYTVGEDQYIVRFLSPQATGLPVIRIDTENGVAIKSKEIWTTIASLSLADPNNPSNDIAPRINGNRIGSQNIRDEIRGRGNDSWNNPWAKKKSYRFRTRNNENHFLSLFGLEKARNWILHAQYRDPTLLFNTIAFELGNRLEIPFNHSYNFVELYMNGEYMGNYLLTEQNEVAKGRMDIDQNDGWFVEIDGYFDKEPKFITPDYNLPVMIKSPEASIDELNINNPAYDFVKSEINAFASAVAHFSFPENGYRDLINMKTFIDFILIQEIVNNYDFTKLVSTYMYKDKDEFINMGPLWDFDCGYGDTGRGYFYTHNNRMQLHVFFDRFFQDPIFVVKYKERWKEKYNEIVSILDFIDELANKLEKSAEQNFQTWWFKTYAPWTDTHISTPNDFLGSISSLKIWYNDNVSLLNSELNKIETLPASKNFGTAIYDEYSEIPPQTFTIVAYGNISDISARLQKNGLSAFEISSEWTKSLIGNEGYYSAAISVKPKELLLHGIYTDVLVLRGVNQEKPFTLNVPLAFTVEGKEKPSNIRLPQISSGFLSVYAKNSTIVLENLSPNAKVEVYNLRGQRIYSANTVNSQILHIGVQAKGMYVVKVLNQTLRVLVM